MIAEVHLKDDRTVFQFPARRAIRNLIEGAPGDDKVSERAFVVWDKREQCITAFEPVRLTYLREPAIAFICEAQAPCEGVKAMADERRRRWEERCAAEAAEVDAATVAPIGGA